MKPIIEVLQNILLKNLIEDTPAKVATAIGSHRSTLSRIMDGSAGVTATDNFCRQVEEHYGMSREYLYILDTYLDRVKWLRGLLKTCSLDTMEILPHLISGDVECFQLPLERKSEILRFRTQHIDESLGILSFDYFDRIQTTISGLCDLLLKFFPNNALGRWACSTYLNSPIAMSKYPERVKQIEMGTSIIKCFCNDYVSTARFKHMIPLNGIEERSYWDDNDKDNVILLKARSINRGGNILYDFFNIRRADYSVKYCGQLIFMDNNLASLILNDGRTAWATYVFNNDVITLKWLSPNAKPKKSDMRHLPLRQSQSLRILNRNVSDYILDSFIYKAKGMQILSEYKVSDVIITRDAITLCTSNHHHIRINKNRDEFLLSVETGMDVIIYKDLDDNQTYVEWSVLGRRINMKEFIVTKN